MWQFDSFSHTASPCSETKILIYKKRKELFEARKSAVEDEIKNLQKTLSLLEFKCWYYQKAMEDGTEEYIQAMLPDKLPDDIQKLYDASHE